ncbi:MAG: ATP synthase F1 subunit epsilon [Ignavibacteriae bacterium]|nr:ATP synthase F1 subunit epsilon [Ignavibacteriota bacterium]MCB9217354.1 ATP synthase F1 subunit epsilon [Ignavibacteria bacterium]
MAKTFQLDIRTPEGVAWQGDVEIVTLPGRQGTFQVLINHAPLLTELEVGELRLTDEHGKEQVFASSGGFAEVRLNEVTVLSETIEPAQEINRDRAMSAKARAEERIKEVRINPGSDINRTRAEAALARAENRLKVVARL